MAWRVLPDADPKFASVSLWPGAVKPSRLRARSRLMSGRGSADFGWHKEKGIFL